MTKFLKGTTALAGIVAAGFALSASIETQKQVSADTPQTERDRMLSELLDPTLIARTLCGAHGQERGGFFRPEFQLALAGKANAREAADDGPPLWDNLGDYSYKISTEDPMAQAYFDQGVRLTYSSNHWEAIRAFKKAQAIDPNCAMCYWAEAFAHGPNINAPMDPSAVEPAFAAISKALAVKSGANEKEQALVDALATRYSPDADADRAVLDQAFADAMGDVHRAYPDDHFIAALYAEAVMDTTPWEYWERDFTTPKPMMVEPINAIEKVLAENPDHAGAIHLYIHLTEASQTLERAEPYADRLAPLIPGAGHMVHMPSHTYFRVGRYLDSLHVNVLATKADEDYLATTQGSDIYRYGYYPHNVHFVLVSAQMAGDKDITLEFADKLGDLIPFAAMSGAPWMEPIKQAAYFAWAQFGEDEDVLALDDPGMEYPYIKASWHYARGLVFARQGDNTALLTEADAITALQSHEHMVALEEGRIQTRDVLAIAENTLRARAHQNTGEYDAAVPLLEEAAELQDNLTYTEPAHWYYPVRQTLGAVYLQAERYEDAAAAFRHALIGHPNNAWSLYGLMKAQEGMGDPAAAMTAELYKKASATDGDLPLNKL